VAEFLGAQRVGWVWPEGRQDDRPASRQRAPRPPDVEGRNVAVADRLLPPGVLADPLDWEVDLDQTLGVARRLYRHDLRLWLSDLRACPIFAGGPRKRFPCPFLALYRTDRPPSFEERNHSTKVSRLLDSPVRNKPHHQWQNSPAGVCCERVAGCRQETRLLGRRSG